MSVWTINPNAALLTVFLVLMNSSTLSAQPAPQKYHHDLTTKYFTQVSMVCDHPDLNVTQSRDIRSMSWMLPDGSMVDASSPLNPSLYLFSGLEGSAPMFSAYNLTALSVDDNVFGYYTCVIVHNSPDRMPTVIRWGLNVDGADFSDLMETYKTNAIIGGCAAAAMLLIVGGGCLVWNIRQGRRSEEEEEEADSDLTVVAESKGQSQGENNHAYASDMEVTTSIDNYTDIVKQDISVKM